jgi:hypothetical protein
MAEKPIFDIAGLPPLRTTIKRGLISNGVAILNDLLSGAEEKNWGVFSEDGKKKILDPDNFMGIEFTNNSRISDYPIEGGSFQSYNKIATPYDAVITMSKGGTGDDRKAFTAVLENVLNTLDVYTIITPDEIFKSACVEHYTYRRTQQSGANIIIAEIYFREVKKTAQARFNQTRSGAQVESSVPEKEKTNPTTSTGLPSLTATVPSARAVKHYGAVALRTISAYGGLFK